MNLDALKLAELRETRRSNLAKEGIEATKAGISDYGTKAAAIANRAKALESGMKAAGSIMGMIGKNSPEWEVPAEPAAVDAANLSFFSRSWGESFSYGPSPMLEANDFGLAVLDWRPMLGHVRASTISPLFVALKALYDKLRGKNRGATNYTVNDLIRYYLPVISIYVRIAEFERALCVAGMFSNQENYISDRLVEACGLSATTSQQERYRVADRLVQLKTLLAMIPMPLNFHVLQREVYLASFCFVDSTEQVVQVIVPRMDMYYDDGVAGGAVYLPATLAEAVSIDTKLQLSYNQVIGQITVMADQIKRTLQDTTFQAIAGDIYNAFDVDGLIKLSGEIDFSRNPLAYDEEFLAAFRAASIHNLKKIDMAGSGLGLNQYDVTLDANGQLGQGWLTAGAASHADIQFYNQSEAYFANVSYSLAYMPAYGTWRGMLPTLPKWDSYTPEMVYVASRFMTEWSAPEQPGATLNRYQADGTLTTVAMSATNNAELHTYGTEVVTEIRFYGVTNSSLPTTNHHLRVVSLMGNFVDSSTDSVGTPDYYLGRWDVLPDIFDDSVLLGEKPDSYAIIPSDVFRNIEYNALLTLWNVPAFSRSNAFTKAKFTTPEGGKPYRKSDSHGHKGKKGDKSPQKSENTAA